MPGADVRRVKALARRLGTRDSEIIRFAVKAMLARLAPLYDPEVRGGHLVPAFVESGPELLRFFDIDAARLEAIINDGVDASSRVGREDIALLALDESHQPYATLKLTKLGNDTTGAKRSPQQALREYLYERYVYQATEPGEPRPAEGAPALSIAGHQS